MASAGRYGSHDITIEDRSAGTPKYGYMLHRPKGARLWQVRDAGTIPPRLITSGEYTQAETVPEIEVPWYQENWQAGMGLVNHRLGNGSVGIAEGYKVDTSSPSGVIRLARQLQASTVDSNPDEYKATGFAMVGTESWAFIGRDVYSWDYTNKNWDVGTEPVAVARVYRNGVNYEGNTYVPAWAEDAGSGGLYTGSDLPTPYIYKADADANWTLSTLGPTAFDAARFMCKADDKLWAGYLAAYTDTTDVTSGFDAAASSGNAGSATLTFAHTCSGNNRLLLVAVTWQDAAPTTISGVTYNAVAMTQVGSTQSSGNWRGALFRLIAPATGANNVVVTLNAAQTTLTAGAASFFEVHQTTPLGTAATATGTSTSPSVAVTSTAGDLVFGSVHWDATSNGYTPHASQTARFDRDVSAAGCAGDTEIATGASTTMSGTLGGSVVWIAIGVAIKPSFHSSSTTLYVSADPTGSIAAGDVLRLGTEYLLCTAITVSPPSLTVVRGYRGTLTATQTAQSLYKVALSKHAVRSSSDGTNTGSWSAATTIGTSDAEITGVLPYYSGTAELALVLKTDGLWTLTAAGTLVHLYDLQAEQHTDNGRGAFAWEGNRRIIIPKGSGGMWELFEGEIRDISFSLVMPAQTQLHGKVVAGAADSGFCFVLVQETANTKYHLMMGELVSIGGTTDYRWHHVAAVTYTTGTTAGQCAVFACGVPSGANVHHRVQVGISSSGSNLLPYFYTLANDTEDRYTGDDNGYAVTVKDDRGHPNSDKRYDSVTFTTKNLGSGGTDHYIEVKYRVDGGSWTYVTGAQAGSTLTTNPQTLTFAQEITGKTLEYQFLPFQGTTTTTGPEILDFRTSVQLRPSPEKLYPVTLELRDGMPQRNGARDNPVSNGALAQLRTWNAQAAEVKLTDPDNTARNMIFLPGTWEEQALTLSRYHKAAYLVKATLLEV